jgi:hypothetical protein
MTDRGYGEGEGESEGQDVAERSSLAPLLISEVGWIKTERGAESVNVSRNLECDAPNWHEN